MADVKWIKICTDIFNDEKMVLIENMPEADAVIVIWFKLLCMAGKQNNSGVFMMNDKIAYTDEMLATVFRRPLNTVRLALKTFETYGMIEIVDNVVTIPNWEKHQSLDAMEKAKEQNRLELHKIPCDIDYDDIPHLALEARQKLKEIRPETIGQASRISGVNPADISVLMVYLKLR